MIWINEDKTKASRSYIKRKKKVYLVFLAKAECKGNFSRSAVKRISQTHPICRGRSLSDRRTSHSPSPTFPDTKYSRTAGHSWEKLFPAATRHKEVPLVYLNHFCIFPRIQWTHEPEPFPRTKTGCCRSSFVFVPLKPKSPGFFLGMFHQKHCDHSLSNIHSLTHLCLALFWLTLALIKKALCCLFQCRAARL